MSKTDNRIVAFEIIYSLEVQETKYEDYKENVEAFLEINEIYGKSTTKYIKDVVYGAKRYQEQIKRQIEECLSEKWSYDRISKIDIAILNLAIFEMLFFKTPYKVVINEAVELAKIYSDEKSPSFINGVLASIVKKNSIDKGETNGNI